MKSRSHIKFANIFDLSQLHFDSLERLAVCDSNHGNTGNRQLQKHQFVRVAFALRNRRHRSINWRWQSRLINWF
jgi:hypothetical protein